MSEKARSSELRGQYILPYADVHICERVWFTNHRTGCGGSLPDPGT